MVDAALSDMAFLNRVQSAFNPEDMTEDNIQEFLLNGKRSSGKAIKERKDGQIIYDKKRTLKGASEKRNLARVLANTKTVYEDVNKFQIDEESPAESLDKLEDLKTEAQGLPVHSSQVVRLIEPKIREAQSKEREFISIQQEAEKLFSRVENIKSKPVEEQKDLFRSGNAEERKLAAVALKEESPQVLGGLISGEKRRVGRAIRFVFD